jgi:hypothetical protein
MNASGFGIIVKVGLKKKWIEWERERAWKKKWIERERERGLESHSLETINIMFLWWLALIIISWFLTNQAKASCFEEPI